MNIIESITNDIIQRDSFLNDITKSILENDTEKGFEVKYKTELSAIIDNMNWTILRLLKAYLKNRPK